LTGLRRRTIVLCAAGAALFVSPQVAAAALPDSLSANEHVNVLFIGFDELQYTGHEGDPHDFQAIYSDVIQPAFLPATADPVVDYTGQELGHLDINPHIAVSDEGFNDRFFHYLDRIGVNGPRTRWQDLYNDQQYNYLDVPETVSHISGPKVEAWLERNFADVPGLRPGADTIVFINWFSRPDFQFHVYHGESVDPDTGRDESVVPNRVGSAWGGSSGPLTFYDFSAGPDTLNWNVDDFEFFEQFSIGSDGDPDGRILPIWEMSGGWPGFIVEDATTAAGLLSRFTIFSHISAGDLYDPLPTLPKPGGSRVIDFDLFRMNPDEPYQNFLHPGYVMKRLRALAPYTPFRYMLREDPYAGEPQHTYEVYGRAMAGLPPPDGCWEDYGYTQAQLYCFFAENADTLVPAGPKDHPIPVSIFEVDQDVTDSLGRFHALGLADTDPQGRPYGIFSQVYPRLATRIAGYSPGEGMSEVLTHEIGHELGLRHEHDGIDTEALKYFSPYSGSMWLWALDSCECNMGYMSIATRFGAFERANLNRNLAGRLYPVALALRDQVSARVRAKMTAKLRRSEAAYRSERLFASATNALDAYYLALRHGASPKRAATAGGRGGPPRKSIVRNVVDPSEDSEQYDDVPFQNRFGVRLPPNSLRHAYLQSAR
jgi:hypothetical protein